jgi:hypothetical protein
MESTELAIVQEAPLSREEPAPEAQLAPARAPALPQTALAPRSFGEVRELAELAVASGLLPEAISTPEAAFVVIATGMELGLSPMQSLRGIHVVEGKPILAADLLVALAKRSPECLYFRLVESTYERATYETHRRGEPKPTSLTWTLEDARRADLIGRRTWKAHPAAMLRARCAAALARAVYPDLLLGVYEESEGEEIKEGRAGRHKAAPRPAPEAPRSARAAPKEPPRPAEPREEPLRPKPRRAPPLRERLLADVDAAETSDALRQIVRRASGAKKAGALSREEFQEVARVATERHNALSGRGISRATRRAAEAALREPGSDDDIEEPAL